MMVLLVGPIVLLLAAGLIALRVGRPSRHVDRGWDYQRDDVAGRWRR